jgi:hypothetical protein
MPLARSDVRSARGAARSVDERVAALATRQYGVVTHGQLVACGLNRAAIQRRVRNARLRRVHRWVFAVGHAALPREGAWLAAVYATGQDAALSHRSAAELLELGRFRSPRISVVNTGHTRVTGVDTYRTRHLDSRDVTVHKGIRTTTVARTLVDLTDVLTAHQLAHVINEAAFRRRLDLADVRAAMERANGRRNLKLLWRAIDMYLGGSAGTRSSLEDAFLALVAEAGLPEPLVNVSIEGDERDFSWPDHALVVEVDGPGHERPTARSDDERRDETLAHAGYEVLRITELELAHAPREVVMRVQRALGTAGDRGRWAA